MHLMILALLLFFHFSCTENPQINELLDSGLMENNREREADRGKEDLGKEVSDEDMGLAEGGTSHDEMIENDLDRGLEEQRDPNDLDFGGNMMNEEDMDMSNESSLVPSLALGEMHANQSLHSNTLNVHPHLFDVYLPNTLPSRVIVFLHGGLGNKESIAEKLGLRTEAQIHQEIINSLGVAWVIPQGQAIQRNGLNVPTWSNRVMSSGADDLLFLSDLSTWIRSNWNGIPLVLSGHSNGGMMTHRIWCEAPELYSLYVGVSGPPSTSYDYDYEGINPVECIGGPPYWAMIGSEDRTIGVNEQANWTISVADSDLYERTQDHVINEQRAHEFIRTSKVCELSRRGQETELSGITQWSTCRGRVLLWWVNQPEPNRLEARNRSYGHEIDSLESVGNFVLREELATWSP